MLLSPISFFSFPFLSFIFRSRGICALLPLVTFFRSSMRHLFYSSFNDGVCVQVAEKDPRKGATPVKGSAASAGARGAMNRIQSRRERKLALQQDVPEILCQAQFVGSGCFFL